MTRCPCTSPTSVTINAAQTGLLAQSGLELALARQQSLDAKGYTGKTKQFPILGHHRSGSTNSFPA